MFGHTFTGPGRQPGVNLSTSSSTSSTALLSSVRQERQQRELLRRQELASLVLQKHWRARQDARKVRLMVLESLESGSHEWKFGETGRKLILITGGGWRWDDEVGKRVGKVVEDWCKVGMSGDTPILFEELDIVVIGIMATRILDLISLNPKTVQAAALMSFIETLFISQHYKNQEDKAYFVETLDQRWIIKLVEIMEKLIAASLPKKKHPSLQPVTRLVTAPFNLIPPSLDSPLVPPLLQNLLSIPSLPSMLPLASLTHLSANLPIFSTLLPAAALNPELLSKGRLISEIGKSNLIANLATFGITGGMLARSGTRGISDWIKVMGILFRSLGAGWGRWAEGHVEDEVMQVDEEREEEEVKPKRQGRDRVPSSLGPKLLLIASSAHISILSTVLTSPSSKAPTSLLVDFASFILALLNAFRGSSKWELILDGLMEGKNGKILARRMLREGVRGRWRNTSDPSGWATFSENPSTPCLLFLTHLYNHYLLLTPDDEFFSDKSTNPLTLDEVLDIAGIWRDLAFWGFMNGVSEVSIPHPTSGPGTEEDRALLTRGITRLAARNARRKFAADDFWVMASQMDLKGFVEAAVFEDSELANVDDEEEIEGELPRWARRHNFSRRQMAYISPRLGLLNNLPMTVPFQTRAEVFREFVAADRFRLKIDRYQGNRRFRNAATIHRDNLSEDGFRQLNELGPTLKGTIQITFIDQYGFEEQGIDGGGLFKEFFTSLSKEVFDTNRGLWLVTDQNELYPNPHAYAKEPHSLGWYGFIGRVLGKALYEGILIDVSFADFFLAKWLGRQSYLDDLNSLDKELYKGLIMLKNYPNPDELSLNFTITQEEFGQVESVDLIPNGSEIPVTPENRHEYIQLVCKYKLDSQIQAQSRAFFNGLSDIIDPKWLRMFDTRELQQLIGGEETIIDIDDLRKYTHASGFPNDVTMKFFWKVVKGFSHNERRALLLFVTSCSRPPLLGFKNLNPPFGIRFGGNDLTRLPSASTCANLLKMPGYTDEESLRTKLLQAITSGSGFDMS